MDDYPGAAAAYSLRLLNTDYTGDAVLVRRASDNATQNVGFVDGELDTDALDTFCSGTDGFVATWFDQSGNSNDLTQSTASAQPKIYDSATGVITENSKPAIYTDGVVDFLKSPTLSLSNPNTQFFVLKNLPPNNHIGGIYDDFNPSPALIGQDSDNLRFFQGVGFSPSIPHNQNQILITVKSSTTGTDWAAFYNSNTVTNSGENVGTRIGSVISLGKRNVFLNPSINYFQEYILYDTDETSNRTGIEDNINNFYSIY